MRAIVILGMTVLLIASGAQAGEKLPEKEGECTLTKIKTVGNRIDGAPDSGDFVLYADGLHQVSIFAIPGLKGAKEGDPVKLCLTEIPDDCPPGDDRGRSYKTTDLRTHQTWEANNDEHMCGGA